MHDSVEIKDSSSSESTEQESIKAKVIITQISFSVNDDLGLVETRLQKIMGSVHAGVEQVFVYGGLARQHIEEKGLSPAILDMLDKNLGDRLLVVSQKYDTFAEAMANMQQTRDEIAAFVDRIYLLGLSVAQGIVDEVFLVSYGKVQMFTPEPVNEQDASN
jgi:hypothetical protein